MNGESDVAAKVLRERLDYSIQQIQECAPPAGLNTPRLCGIHSSALVIMLQCWKYSLDRELRVAKWGAIGGIIGGIVSGIGIVVVNYLRG